MDPTSSHLLELPAELRNYIWTLAVSVDDNDGHDPTSIYVITTARKLKEPALVNVCCQIRSEVLPIFYGTMHFRIVEVEHSLAGNFWLEDINAKAKLIRHLAIAGKLERPPRNNIVREDDWSVQVDIAGDGTVSWTVPDQKTYRWKFSLNDARELEGILSHWFSERKRRPCGIDCSEWWDLLEELMGYLDSP